MQDLKNGKKRTEEGEILEYLENKISNLIVLTNNWKYLYYLEEDSKNTFFIDNSKDIIELEEKIIEILKDIKRNKLELDFYYQIIEYVNLFRFGGVSLIKEDTYSIGFTKRNESSEKVEKIIKKWRNIFDVIYIILLKSDLIDEDIKEDKISTPLIWLIQLLEENKGKSEQFNIIYNIGIFSEMSLKINMPDNNKEENDDSIEYVDAIGIPMNQESYYSYDDDDDENWDLKKIKKNGVNYHA